MRLIGTRCRATLSALALIPASVVGTLLVLEVVVRLFVNVSDVPLNQDSRDLGARLAPRQTGVYIEGMPAEIVGHYRINSDGWNSPHEYSRRKDAATFRITVVGDSYVEALNIDIAKAFPYVLERRLAALTESPTRIEVDSFGQGGASLAQYLMMIRYVARTFPPDCYIVNLTHNDFTESFEGFGSIYQWNFRVVNQLGFSEVPPALYRPSRVRRILVKSALARFVYFNLRLRRLPAAEQLWKGRVRAQQTDIRQFQMPEALVRRLAEHIVLQYKEIAARSGAKLLLVMGPHVPSLQSGEDLRAAPATQYNELAAEVCRALEVDFLDLTEAFREAFREAPLPFNFRVDPSHWNERGHRVAGEAIAKWVRRNWSDDAALRADATPRRQ